MSKQLKLPLNFLSDKKQFTFIDLFAGIGGFRIALDKLGGQCLGYSEIDKQAIKVYQQNFISYFNKHEIELGDITKITELQEYKFPKSLNIHPKVLDVLDELKNINFVEKVKLDANTLFKGVIPPSRTRFQKDDELNDFFIFSDLRNGHTTIHSWDIIKTSDREKMICLTLLKYRRSKKYGDKDGNPLSFENFREIITDIKISELNK
ncbi:MAG: DNA cytosine methyltransferase, partial [Dolichospermum sp.]